MDRLGRSAAAAALATAVSVGWYAPAALAAQAPQAVAKADRGDQAGKAGKADRDDKMSVKVKTEINRKDNALGRIAGKVVRLGAPVADSVAREHRGGPRAAVGDDHAGRGPHGAAGGLQRRIADLRLLREIAEAEEAEVAAEEPAAEEPAEPTLAS